MIKKEEVLQIINNINSLLNELEALNKHPYSAGVRTDLFINDLKKYLEDCKKDLEKEDKAETKE